MKKTLLILGIALSNLTFGQSHEAQQLLLNWEKLQQFRAMLADMKKGYEILHKGYSAIRNLSEGNFSLHKFFLDALLEVSPAVRNYKKIGEIIRYQLLVADQAKKAMAAFNTGNQFNKEELQYISKVLANVCTESVRKLEELLLVITAGKLRMSDDERLWAIDRIHDEVQDQFLFIKDFTGSSAYLQLQRKNEQADIQMSKKIRGY